MSKRANEQSLAHSLFKKEKMSDRSFAVTKRAKEQKTSGFPNHSFFAQKKSHCLLSL